MNNVISFYENYDEESRLSTDNARKVEFTVTTTILNQHIKPHYKVLELGAGTGAYSFYYAERGNEVLALDLTPKHVDIIKQKLKARGNGINLSAALADATDLGGYESGGFDVVLCLGPMYHLSNEHDRVKCMEEALRVLKPGGILAVAYINKHYIVHAVMANQKQFFTQDFMEKILDYGYDSEGEKELFWTVGFFTTPYEIEAFIEKFNVDVIDHAATDGISALLRNQVNGLGDKEYSVWVSYILKNCRDKNIMGISNHGLVLCRKDPDYLRKE